MSEILKNFDRYDRSLFITPKGEFVMYADVAYQIQYLEQQIADLKKQVEEIVERGMKSAPQHFCTNVACKAFANKTKEDCEACNRHWLKTGEIKGTGGE